jgi:hypothetical protein
VRSAEVIFEIVHLINQDISVISFDPKRLSVLIIKTQSTQAIKALLNQLFQRHRAGVWNSYDTIVAISYLTQSGFRHVDLIDVLCQHSEPLGEYYRYCCRTSFANVMSIQKPNSYGGGGFVSVNDFHTKDSPFSTNLFCGAQWNRQCAPYRSE